jgi:hypothetical protein
MRFNAVLLALHRLFLRFAQARLPFIASGWHQGLRLETLASLDHTTPHLLSTAHPKEPAMNTSTLNTARLLSFAFAALLTLGTLMSVGGLANSAEQSAQWANATHTTGAAHQA